MIRIIIVTTYFVTKSKATRFKNCAMMGRRPHLISKIGKFMSNLGILLKRRYCTRCIRIIIITTYFVTKSKSATVLHCTLKATVDYFLIKSCKIISYYTCILTREREQLNNIRNKNMKQNVEIVEFFDGKQDSTLIINDCKS